MNNQKTRFTIVYNPGDRLDKHGEAPVKIEAYRGGQRKYLKTGIRLKPGEWDAKRREVKGKPLYNRKLREMITDVEKFELSFAEKFGRVFRLADLERYKQGDTIVKATNFSDFALAQIERGRAKWSESAYRLYKRAIDYLIVFNGKKLVHFDILTHIFIDDFDNFLRKTQVKTENANYLYKLHQTIKRYITLAGQMKLMDGRDNPYNTFEFSKEETERTVLYKHEIDRIAALTFFGKDAHLAFYRDAFLFSFYTLLRISDVTTISSRHIQDTDKGMLLEIKAKKTGKDNRLPLYELHPTNTSLSKPEQLVKRYNQGDGKPLFDRAHPIINKYVSKLLKMAGIEKPATFHTARHSGITYLVQMKLPLPYIQRLAQHSSITTTMLYVHIANMDLEDALLGTNWHSLKENSLTLNANSDDGSEKIT